MINRENWKAVNQYLKYRREVDLLSSSSVRLEKTWLRHLLEWADSVGFAQVSRVRPSFPQQLLSLSLSPIYTTHIIRASYRFFSWLVKHQRGYSSISAAWMDTLKVRGMVIEHREHEAVTIEEIRAISCAPVQTIRDRRIRASAVFWWLSGIRVGAFVTLPVSAVDLDLLTVRQWPKLGVKTKFKKHATTFLLDIPDLIEVVKDWDKEVRAARSVFWFASCDPETGLIDPVVRTVGVHRNIRAGKDLRDWLGRVGLPYHSPHKFRHGHAVYALKQAKDIPALKAISQNLMHSNLSTTDGVYGILSDMDVKKQIQSLGK
ncbi:MAG: site-specific integrase [Chloroflexi bacterium]|nr:site-specific integrase [Chloroflexota bacterium]